MSNPSEQLARDAATVPGGSTYAGLFLVALATLMYETLLTRIFSVTLNYHFAFVAISVAMFGMTVGALLVYQLPRFFLPERTRRHMALSAAGFGLGAIVGFLIHVRIPSLTGGETLTAGALVPTYIAASIPFVFGGICVCLALTRFPTQVGGLYAADLVGAALGCIAFIVALEFTDGPTAVILVAVLAALAAYLFAADGGGASLRRGTAALAVALAAFALTNGLLAGSGSAPLRIIWVKGQKEKPLLFEAWNSHSRITVDGAMDTLWMPSGWGLSPRYPTSQGVRELKLWIDSTAGTPLPFFDGDLAKADMLRYDIVNLVHYLRADAEVLAIGSGGGRDVLAALAFKQKAVIGVEINKDIIRAVTGTFGDFTGHLDANPRVTFVNDEARSYLARTPRKLDIIQISLIDTWAATAAGALALTENSLYTTEAWTLFLNRLTPRGVLTVSRWYTVGKPSEIYRTTALATVALKRLGVANPRDHILIARAVRRTPEGEETDGVGTVMVAREPWTEIDLQTFEYVVSRMGFEVVLSPRAAKDATFAALASPKDYEAAVAAYPLNLDPPTDDSPYFFHMMKMTKAFDAEFLASWARGANVSQMHAVTVLTTLLFAVAGLTLLCIVVPLALTADRKTLSGATPLFVYFASIGLGFLLVEIAQMQRLIMFLGHPAYALSVVLFCLLLSGGAGSWLTQRYLPGRPRGFALLLVVASLAALALVGLVTPAIVAVFAGSATWTRIAISSALVAIPGVFMGMCFPIGMRTAGARAAALTPWLWGINGAASVCASVLAVVIALSAGISASLWTGVACYAAAALALLRAGRRSTSAEIARSDAVDDTIAEPRRV